jgi:hypothetical protein
MKRAVFVVTVLVAFFAATGAFAFDPNTLNKVTFDNTTGNKIEMIFLSPGDSDHWGPDIIGADYVMKDNSTLGYYVDYPNSTAQFDILAIDDKGNKFEVYNYELTDGKEATITLTKKNLNGGAPDFKLATVEVTNNTGNEIEYLFISADDTEAWGADLLDENTTLADGDTHSVVIPVGKDKVKYYVMAADADNNEYQFSLTLDANKAKTYTVSVDPSDMQ